MRTGMEYRNFIKKSEIKIILSFIFVPLFTSHKYLIKIALNMNTLPVSVILGNPRVNCSRLGICSLEGTEPDILSFRPISHRNVYALLSVTPDAQLQLSFPLETMLPITRKMFFGEAGFIIEEKKPLPYTICQKLALPLYHSFSDGVWPIKEEDGKLVVTIGVTTLVTS